MTDTGAIEKSSRESASGPTETIDICSILTVFRDDTAASTEKHTLAWVGRDVLEIQKINLERFEDGHWPKCSSPHIFSAKNH